MKLIFNIDKDDLKATVFLLKLTPDEKKKVREYLDTHDEIEVPAEVMDKEESGMDLAISFIALGFIALGSIGHETEKQG